MAKGSSGSGKSKRSKRTTTAAARRSNSMANVSSRNTGSDTPF